MIPAQQAEAFNQAMQLAVSLTLRSFASWNIEQVKRFHDAIDSIWAVIKTEPEKRKQSDIDDAFARLRWLREQVHPDAMSAFDRMIQIGRDIMSQNVAWVPAGGKHL